MGQSEFHQVELLLTQSLLFKIQTLQYYIHQVFSYKNTKIKRLSSIIASRCRQDGYWEASVGVSVFEDDPIWYFVAFH